MHDVLDLRELLSDEIVQRRESGYELDGAAASLEPDSVPSDELARRLDELESLRRSPGWHYDEPSTWDEIVAARGEEPPTLPPLSLSEAELRNRLHAAWLGRCAGCNLGKPFEGWGRDAIRSYLTAAGAFPLDDYVPLLDPVPDGLPALNESWPETTRGRIRAMARDDDTDYTILALHLLETHGLDFTTEDVAREWLLRLPFMQVYTAERAAYRNLILGLKPPLTARYRNPYREWIGAQIRADVFGYVCPGDPEAAARLGFVDASLSHVANGIYGEMWAAALIGACFTATSMSEALAAALAVVPARSRLAEALRHVAEQHARGVSWDDLRDGLEQRYGSLSFVHTINNAAVVAAALLYGEADFSRTIGLAVEGGWDTDCNGATAGSAFGAMHGTDAIPEHWVAPLNDRIRSAIFGYDNSRISELAERTLKLALRHTPLHA
ncbi:MAG TPA: ADP-ribosylglycohydrolase family protein [Solirubrobacter sp.]|nr:ADP-ribosylglycohydrolase family protein [Solirubrobacter sp.]